MRGPHSQLGDLHHGQAVRKAVFGRVFRLPERRSLSVTLKALWLFRIDEKSVDTRRRRVAERVLPRRAIHRLQNNSSMRIVTLGEDRFGQIETFEICTKEIN